MCNVLLLLALGGAAPAQAGPAAPARITVRLPRDATLYVNDRLCTLTSDVRSFDTPALTPGRNYTYQLRAEVVRGGRTVSATKTVTFRAGSTAEADFRDLGRADAARSAAAPASALPQGDPPLQAQAALQDGEVQLTIKEYVPLAEQRQRTVMVEGREQTMTYTAVHYEARQRTESVPADQVQAFGVDGRALDSGRLAEFLRRPRAVLFTVGVKPDPSSLRMYKDGTVVLVLPAADPGAPPLAPAPAPAPAPPPAAIPESK